MKAAYAVAKLIDRVNTAIFRVAAWLVLVVTLVSSLNATVRWAFNYSSNAYLDLQLYLFAAVFLICAGYTFLENEHVRIDVLSSRFSRRTKLWVDVFGILFFLLPFAGLTLWLSWAPFVDAFFSKETSPNAGGLIVWPARLLVVIGFFLLVAQGISELIKRLTELGGHDVGGPGPEAGAQGLAKQLQGGARGRRGMIQFLSDNLAPVMFLSMIALFLLGFPIAFTLAAVGMLFAWIGIELGLLAPTLLLAIPERMYGVIANETLLAIPFFTFMGLILERSKMAEDLLDTVGQIFGPVRGGIAYAVVLVGALLAATTGIVAASVISMGLISLPIMLRYGYDRRLASGVITASGTLAQIVPPSLVLIVMADALAVSVGDLYRAAFLPAMVLIGFYLLYVFTFTVVRPDSAPALPEEARATREPNGASGHRSLLVLTVVATLAGFATLGAFPDSPTDEAVVIGVSGGALTAFVLAVLNRLFRARLLSALAQRVTFALIPPLALVFLVLGSIFLGLATPTEGGAMGATGALIMAYARKRLPLDQLVHALRSTAKLTTFVMFIVIGARMFSLTFYAVNGHVWVEHLFASLPGGETGFLIIVALLIFVLAFFLDFFEIAFIAVPLIAVAAKSLGIDLVLLGVIIGMTLQTAFLHPPFGMALFYLRGVAPEREYVDDATGKTVAGLTTGQIYRGAIPFMLIQLVTVAVLIGWPGLVSTGRDSKPAVDAETVEDQLRQFESLQFDQSPGLIE